MGLFRDEPFPIPKDYHSFWKACLGGLSILGKIKPGTWKTPCSAGELIPATQPGLATSVSSMQEQQHSLPMKQQYATITSAHMIFQLTTPCLYIRLYMFYVCICGHMLACQAATNMLTSTLVRARCWGLFWIIKYCGIRTSSLKFSLVEGELIGLTL